MLISSGFINYMFINVELFANILFIISKYGKIIINILFTFHVVEVCNLNRAQYMRFEYNNIFLSIHLFITH